MINRKEITNVAKRMLRQHRGLEDPQIIHPQREWLIGVGFSVLVFTLIVWWSVSSYIEHAHTDTDISAEVGSTDAVYREVQVNAALELFAEKSEKFNKLVGDIPAQPEIVESVVEEESVITDETELEEETSVVEEVVTEVIPAVEEDVMSEVLE